MRSYAWVIVFCASLACATAAKPDPKRAGSFAPLIQSLYKSILNEQVKQDTKWIPFISDAKVKGLFPSWIHVNFHGNEAMYQLRERVRFWDANHFVTNWVLQAMLETEALGSVNISASPSQPVQSALNVLLNFKDKTFPPGVPIMDFWPQTLDKYGKWQQFPTNIGNAVLQSDSLGNYIAEALERLGFSELAQQINGSLSMLNEFISAFHIPADFDDTAVNLALGVRLSQSSVANSAFPMWSKQFYDFQTLAEQWVNFAYDPFSTQPNATNLIDPRTYFWLRGFLDQEFEAGTKSLLLIPTWAMDLLDDIANFKDGDKMPFNANNVDASVSANGIYGLTLAALNGLGSSDGSLPYWFTPQLQQLYGDTSRMLAWTVNADVLSWRPDLALLYYPPIYDMYWFIARSVHELGSTETFPFPEMAQAAQVMTDAMMGAGTQQLLRRAQSDRDGFFWDDFLGDNDTDIFGRPLNRGEDRIFSTAVATSALLDTWTVAVPGKCMRSWRSSTPSNVKSTIVMAGNWLAKNVDAGKLALENAFFAGSMKSGQQGPWFFPANRIENFDGTPIPPTNQSAISGSIIDSVQGYIPKAQYEQMLQQKWFGVSPPQHFTGYNAPNSVFPYWSSPTFTKSVVMLTLSKIDSVNACAV